MDYISKGVNKYNAAENTKNETANFMLWSFSDIISTRDRLRQRTGGRAEVGENFLSCGKCVACRKGDRAHGSGANEVGGCCIGTVYLRVHSKERGVG